MAYTLYELTFYFLVYSFLGWCLEIAYAAVRKRRFLNRGVLNGPLCPVYGLGMVFSMIFFDSAHDNFFFLIISCGAVATILEFFTGLLMEFLFKKRWWDYSDYRYNIGGYVCLPFSALWGLLAAIAISFTHPVTTPLLHLLPGFIGRIFLLICLVLLAIDFLSVLGVIFHVQHRGRQLEELANDMQQFSNRLGRSIFMRIERRMVKAHPVPAHARAVSTTADSAADKTASPAAAFAPGCGFDKLVWLFMISALLGDITETIYCYAVSGQLMSRSSVVYGPFSIVWGLGVMILSIMLHRYQNKPDRYIFLFGAAVGGVYEYICSVFTELVFGTIFWDYSKIPFNVGGRINLLFCFFWGIAAVVWIKLIYPVLSGLIERIPPKPGRIMTWWMVCFMSLNILISGAAMYRYAGRQAGITPQNGLEAILDERFPDTRMQQIYPNAKILT